MIACKYLEEWYLGEPVGSRWTLFAHGLMPHSANSQVEDSAKPVLVLKDVPVQQLELYPSVWWNDVPVSLGKWAPPWDVPSVTIYYGYGWGSMRTDRFKGRFQHGAEIASALSKEGWTRCDDLMCVRIVPFRSLDLSVDPLVKEQHL